MAERRSPPAGPKNDGEAIRWLLTRHDAPCGDAQCDSVYCYIAKRLRDLPSPRERFVRVAVELVEQLKANPSQPVTLQIIEKERGELEFVATQFSVLSSNSPNKKRPSSEDSNG